MWKWLCKNSKPEIPETNNPSVLNHAPAWVVWWHRMLSHSVFPSLVVAHSFVQCILPASHSVPAQFSDQLLSYHSACVHITLVLLSKGPQMQESQCWQFRYAKEKPWSVSFKWKAESSWLSEERKISHAKVDKICSKNESSVKRWRRKKKSVLIFLSLLRLWKLWPQGMMSPLVTVEKALLLLLSLQSCPTLCDPIRSSPPGSPVPGILQARTLEWVAISFFNAWRWKVKVKSLSRVRPSVTAWTAAYQAPLSMEFSRQEYWSGVPLPSPGKGVKFVQ